MINNHNSAIGIDLQIPLTNNMQVRNKLKPAKVAELQVKEQALTTRIELRQAIVQDFVNMDADYTTYKLQLSQEDFGQSFHAAEIGYTNGPISTVDYVIAKNNFNRVQLNLVVAKYNYMLAPNCSIFTRTVLYGKWSLRTQFLYTHPVTMMLYLNGLKA